jgi:hypothetical protein
VDGAVIWATVKDVLVCSGVTVGFVSLLVLWRVSGWGRDVQR